jgi:hypothetical protein
MKMGCVLLDTIVWLLPELDVPLNTNIEIPNHKQYSNPNEEILKSRQSWS